MYYGGIKKCDIANGPGVRVSLFVSGCRNHCIGCFQPETWNFRYGKPYTKKEEEEILAALDSPNIEGFTVLGGEPFEPENQEVLVSLLEKIRKKFPEKNVWSYTGYTVDRDLEEGGEKHTPYTDRMLRCIDVIVDGRFEQALKDITLLYRGSRNQRILPMKDGKIDREAFEKGFLNEDGTGK